MNLRRQGLRRQGLPRRGSGRRGISPIRVGLYCGPPRQCADRRDAVRRSQRLRRRSTNGPVQPRLLTRPSRDGFGDVDPIGDPFESIQNTRNGRCVGSAAGLVDQLLRRFGEDVKTDGAPNAFEPMGVTG